MNDHVIAMVMMAAGIAVLAYACGTARKLKRSEFSGLMVGAIGFIGGSSLWEDGFTAELLPLAALLLVTVGFWTRDLRAQLRKARAS